MVLPLCLPGRPAPRHCYRHEVPDENLVERLPSHRSLHRVADDSGGDPRLSPFLVDGSVGNLKQRIFRFRLTERDFFGHLVLVWRRDAVVTSFDFGRLVVRPDLPLGSNT